ncbi:DUF1428 domain-containing protein [Chenggangzhangella methanolivorans]|uniref:DUF1428 domain-containing protein n=1 Tax=Chenggangzhangella methanolivorans TaxID=1437009 RepID=A0A9E6R9S2_9HYPH|nr:DUF1428 domain-containing protein [Chenggangzhangella methanolivorans]QZO00162.1 DUF1428 domain-containing protein [Chenggangzhangella methanolivorans]
MAYVQGFVIPAAAGRKDDYREMAEQAAEMFKEYGALRIVECWGVDVQPGETADFRRAVRAKDGEEIVFSFIVWPDKATCDAAAAKMEADERMTPPEDAPFSMDRMIFGGFEPLFDSDGEL